MVLSGAAGVTTPTGNPAIRDRVSVRLPAEGAYLAVLRMVTAGVAARLDFTLDAIEDLKIAIDEACAMLLPVVVGGAELDVTFGTDDEALQIEVRAVTEHGTVPSRDSFAWTVLTALVDHVDSTADLEQRVSVTLRMLLGRARGLPA